MMKDQYAGDINDYSKYALLRALARANRGRLHVCWMLTPADRRTDGARVAYLQDAARFRDFDPPVFDALAKLVSEGRRSVGAVEAANILAGATFHTGILADTEDDRQRYFADLRAQLGAGDLVFFDPDNGLEVASVPRGRRSSSKYLYWDELADTLGDNRAVCVYQHFPRRTRAAFVATMFDRLGQLASGHHAFAVYSPWVAYIICAPAVRADLLYDAVGEVAARPGARLVLERRR
jgi:hypothetical protein